MTELAERRRKSSADAPAITEGDAVFSMENGFLYMAYPKEATPCRVMLHRNFPLEFPYEYISVQNTDGTELASVRRLDDFSDPARTLLQTELERKYYSPAILKILSIKERFGFSYWDTETAAGRLTFTLQDTYKSIIRTGGSRIFIVDVEGNRFTVENVDALDRRSRKKLEIYL